MPSDVVTEPRARPGDLVATLDGVLPASLPPGAVSAVLLIGSCFTRRGSIAGLSLLVDGVAHAPTAWGAPRPALCERLRAAGEDAWPNAYRSGFWGTVPVRAGAAGDPVRIEVEAELDDGGRVRAEIGAIEVAAPDAPAEPAGAEGRGDLIAVCMATYDPDPELFARQIDSLRRQSDERWVCLISDDCSAPEPVEVIEREIAGDPRFVLSRSPVRIGFYRNFERALRMAPREAALVALSDQDDHWYADKLSTLRAEIGDAALVYSDQRRVDREGTVISDSLWETRRRNHSDFTSMLLANTIVGASSLFRRDVVDRALPFPEGPGWQFHDHWLSIVALSEGRIAFVDQPLYDYVQHDRAIVGRVGVEEGARSGARTRLGLRSRLLRARGIYFRSYLQLALQARVVLERGGDELEPSRRAAARRLIDADRSIVALIRLGLRPLRGLLGRNETLGTESHLLVGLLWRRAARALAVGSRGPGRPGVETELPPFDIEGIGQRRLKRWLAGG